jgi:hypothetical protein
MSDGSGTGERKTANGSPVQTVITAAPLTLAASPDAIATQLLYDTTTVRLWRNFAQ